MIQGPKKKIFVVDDEEIMQEALRDFISTKSHHEVEVFGTGEECLKKLDQNPDVIILDYYLDAVMKGAANGMQILETIKSRGSKAHVIMLSSQEQYGVAMKTIIKGAEQYVVKDKDAFDKVLAIISELN
jgi:two-component system, OmpR family, response regulator